MDGYQRASQQGHVELFVVRVYKENALWAFDFFVYFEKTKNEGSAYRLCRETATTVEL